MTSVTGLDGSVTRYEYDALGRRTLTAGGSLTTEYEYDEVGSVVRMATSGDTNVELLYGYDLNGMLTRETRRENGVDTVSEYAYDALNRIASFSNGSVTEAYSYDAAGNMLEKLTNGTAITMTYDAANRMTGMESVNGSIAYAYSASGDLITKTMGELRDSYTYDAAGNLTQYNGYDGYEVKYTYSALNLLTEKVSKGNENRATLEEIVSGKGSENTASNSGTVTARYTYDILQTYANVLTETVDGEMTAYEYGLERIAAYTGTDAEQIKTQYVYDVRGSVIETVTARAYRELSEATAAPTVTVQGYAYTPYGEQIGAKVSGYGYNGEYYDAAAGMLNLRARRYEPAQMRFSQPDIVRGYAINPQSVNRYAYCLNNPVIYADPSGMVFETVKNLWNAAKESTVGKFINEKIVQPVRKTVSACVDAVANVAKNVERVARNAWNEIKIIAQAQAEISRLDKNRATYLLEKQLIFRRACSRAIGDEDSVDEITEQLQRIQSYTNAELRFLTSADLRGFTQEECLEILDVLKEKQDITVDDLMELGIFTEETRYYRYFFGLFKEDVAGECAALLELSYRLNVQHGTSIYEMSLEEQRMRAEEQMQILTLMVAGLGYSLTEEWLFGPEFDPSMYSPDSMLDMLERDGVNWSFLHEQWVPPSGVRAENNINTKTSIAHGLSQAEDIGEPNSIYEQLNTDGTVRSRTFYDANGRPFARQDFNHRHYDKETNQYYQPHEHNFSYNENGQPNGKTVVPVPNGYSNEATN